MYSQLDELANEGPAHPNYDRSLTRRSVLVTTGCRAGVCHGVPLPDRSVEMAGPPRFLGDLRAHALLSDPDGTGTPSHSGVSMLPSAILEHVGYRHSLFRGSITRPAHSLSTLRSQGLPWTTQDSLPAGGWPWPGGSGYPQGPW